MRNYIKSELFRNIKRPYFINFTLIISIMAVMNNLFVVEYGSGEIPVFMMSKMLLGVPVYLVIMFVDMVTSDDIKSGSIKNTVASGLAREKIVLGKLVSTTVLAVLSASIILLSYFISSYFIYDGILAKNSIVVWNFIYSFIGAFFIWIASITIATFLGLTIKSDLGVAISYIALLSIVPKVIKLIAGRFNWSSIVRLVDKLFMTQRLDILIRSENPEKLFLSVVGLGIAYILVFTSLSIVAFRKKDL